MGLALRKSRRQMDTHSTLLPFRSTRKKENIRRQLVDLSALADSCPLVAIFGVQFSAQQPNR